MELVVGGSGCTLQPQCWRNWCRSQAPEVLGDTALMSKILLRDHGGQLQVRKVAGPAEYSLEDQCMVPLSIWLVVWHRLEDWAEFQLRWS